MSMSTSIKSTRHLNGSAVFIDTAQAHPMVRVTIDHLFTAPQLRELAHELQALADEADTLAVKVRLAVEKN